MLCYLQEIIDSCLSSKLDHLCTHTQHNIIYSSGRRLAPIDAYICTRSSGTRDAVKSVSIFRRTNDENLFCFLHFGMAFIVKCSLTIEHVIIAIPYIEKCLKVRGFMGGGGLAPLAPDKLRP